MEFFARNVVTDKPTFLASRQITHLSKKQWFREATYR